MKPFESAIVYRHYNRPVSLIGIIRHTFKNALGGPPMLKVGDPAPDFEAQSHTGQTVKLRDLKGKKVVLWFYPKADTPG